MWHTVINGTPLLMARGSLAALSSSNLFSHPHHCVLFFLSFSPTHSCQTRLLQEWSSSISLREKMAFPRYLQVRREHRSILPEPWFLTSGTRKPYPEWVGSLGRHFSVYELLQRNRIDYKNTSDREVGSWRKEMTGDSLAVAILKAVSD